MNQLITIRDRRQVTLPRSFIMKLGLTIGDKLLLKFQDEEIRIQPIKIKTIDLLDKIQELIKESNISEKELQESVKNIRKQLLQR